MNIYLKNLNKIEFVVTNACTGCCKHCSVGGGCTSGEHIDPKIAADAVRKITAEYDIKTVMTFGGEPLLCEDAVYHIMSAAKEAGVEKLQVITNGYFSKDINKISIVAKRIKECGVNDLLLSVDAFHQETIPIETVKTFAEELIKNKIPTRLQPAWLVSCADENPYNRKTREIIEIFRELGLKENDGNIVFPEGNALKYLSEYFTEDIPQNPYVEDKNDMRCISFSANGDVLNGNIYNLDIMDIIRGYTP